MQYTFFFMSKILKLNRKKKNGQKVRGRAVLFF